MQTFTDFVLKGEYQRLQSVKDKLAVIDFLIN